MKTKEFIKMLQDADPGGESHIRLPDGIPYAAENKPGYWDGAYNYIDEHGNYVTSTMGSKVDIYCMDIDTFVDRHFDHYDSDNLNNIISKFRFSLSYTNDDQRQQYIDRIIDLVKESHRQNSQVEQEFLDENIKETIDRVKAGWRWYSVLDKEGKAQWNVFDEKNERQPNTLNTLRAVIHSKLFEMEIINETVTEWKFKAE